ncbi:MAG: hypothetical protein IKV89_02470 [Clostridia bacterium]|nr:hypothetical protein [Clostridia bacterium]
MTKKKISKELKEQIDNKVVLATSIALVGAMFLLFLQNWSKSIYAAGTMMFIRIAMWVCVACVAAGVVVYFITKKKGYLFTIPYFAVAAWMFSFIHYGLFGLVTLTTDTRFIVLYLCLAVYLIASYVYYGIKLYGCKK